MDGSHSSEVEGEGDEQRDDEDEDEDAVLANIQQEDYARILNASREPASVLVPVEVVEEH